MDSVRMSVAIFPRENCVTTADFKGYPSEPSKGWLTLNIGGSDLVFHSMGLEDCMKMADEIYNAIRIAEQRESEQPVPAA